MSVVLSCGVFAITRDAKKALVGALCLDAVMIPFPDHALGAEEILSFEAHFEFGRGDLLNGTAGAADRLVAPRGQSLHLLLFYNDEAESGIML